MQKYITNNVAGYVMKKLLILAAIVIIGICMFLYIKNNPVGADEKPGGTMVYVMKGRITL